MHFSQYQCTLYLNEISVGTVHLEAATVENTIASVGKAKDGRCRLHGPWSGNSCCIFQGWCLDACSHVAGYEDGVELAVAVADRQLFENTPHSV